MSKEILVLKSSTKSYKTTAIGEVFNKIQRNISLNCRIVTPSPPPQNYPFKPFSSVGEDFCMIVEITGKTGRVRVGINSAGDVASDIKIAIDAFISNGCDWIIAASRTKRGKIGGDTWGTIKAYSQQSYSISVFDYILDSKIPNPKFSILHDKKAELIYERLIFLI